MGSIFYSVAGQHDLSIVVQHPQAEAEIMKFHFHSGQTAE